MKKIVSYLFLLFSFLSFAQASVTKIFLIRHTETVDDGTRDPEVSEVGKVRAKKWAAVLQSEKIDEVYTTDLKRTKYLAQTIAKSQGVTQVKIYQRNMDVIEFLKEIKGKSVVVVGHSNTTPFLVDKIIGKEKYEQINDSDYSNLFIINYFTKQNVSEIVLKIN